MLGCPWAQRWHRAGSARGARAGRCLRARDPGPGRPAVTARGSLRGHRERSPRWKCGLSKLLVSGKGGHGSELGLVGYRVAKFPQDHPL